MFKKISMILSMSALLGLGCLQLMAGGRQSCSSQEESCCPASYQGVPLAICYDTGNTVSCVYMGGGQGHVLSNMYCPY